MQTLATDENHPLLVDDNVLLLLQVRSRSGEMELNYGARSGSHLFLDGLTFR